MAIEKRKLRSGKEVGFDTKRNCYCPLPKNLKNAPVSSTPLEEMSTEELKALADSRELTYHWNAGKEKLIELLKSKAEEKKPEQE